MSYRAGAGPHDRAPDGGPGGDLNGHVGPGPHVFLVRAIGWPGLKGPPAVAKFTVHKHWPPLGQ